MNVHWGYLIQRILSVVRFNSQVLSYLNPDCLLFMTGLFVIGPELFSQLIHVMGAFWCYGRAQRLNVKDDKESIFLNSLLKFSMDYFFVMGPFMIEPGFFLQPLIVMGAFWCYRCAQMLKVKDAKEYILFNFLFVISYKFYLDLQIY